MHPPSLIDATLTALAQQAGANALNWFVALLALLLLAVGPIDWAVRQSVRQRGGEETHSFARLRLAPGLILAIVLGAVLTFAAIAYEVGVGGTFVHVDQAFSEAVRSSTSGRALQLFEWITRLGDGLTLAVLCIGGAALLIARGERRLAFGLVVAMGGNGLLNAGLKRVFERMRPPHEQGLSMFHGWSFPSGHSSGSLVAYGMIAYVLMRTLPRAWHLPVVLLAAATAFSVGASRIFLDAHFASDVAAGFASGTAWLVVCIVSLELVRHPGGSSSSGVAPDLKAKDLLGA